MRLSDGDGLTLGTRSLARPYNGIKRARRRSENLVASSRAASLRRLFEMRDVIAAREMSCPR